MSYGTLKVDSIIFTNSGVDKTVTVSGIVASTTGNLTVTGTVSGDIIRGGTLISGATVTGAAGQFTTITGGTVSFTTVTGGSAGFTSITGTTVSGTTANFVSGVFTTHISGATITGTTGRFTSGEFSSLSGTTITGGTISGVTAQFTTISATDVTVGTITGTTVTGTTANFVSGVFTTQLSGASITGTTVTATSGVFTTITGGVGVFTSGIVAAGTASLPSFSFDADQNTGIYSPAPDQFAVAVGGVENLGMSTTEVVFNNTGADIDFRIEGDTNADLFKIDAGLDQVQVANLNGGPLAGMRNRIINGAMRIAQRGASFPAAANGYNLDRWQWLQLGAMVCTISQSADIPNNTFQTSYKVDVTTADTSIGSLDYAVVAHRIEGHNVRDLIDTTFTLSFWVKSPKAGVHCVGLRNELQDRSFVAPYSVSAVNTWEYKSITVTGGLIAAGGWNWTNGTGLEVAFMLACGAAYHTTASSWNTGNFLATSAQVNVMDSAANDFFLTGVQLEPGSAATPFERRPLGLELELCYRYFQVLTYYGGAYTGANVCYFTPAGFNILRADPAITSSVNAFQFFNGSVWTATAASSFSIYTTPTGTRAIQARGLTGNGALSTPTSAAILGTLSAEL